MANIRYDLAKNKLLKLKIKFYGKLYKNQRG